MKPSPSPVVAPSQTPVITSTPSQTPASDINTKPVNPFDMPANARASKGNDVPSDWGENIDTFDKFIDVIKTDL